jgi:N-acetylglucosamine malate deacetylase 1
VTVARLSIVVVGPHPDDQELGMGGTIARLAAQGHRVLLLDMTDGEPTPHGDRQTRAKESAEAARILEEAARQGAAREGASNPGEVRRALLGLPNRFVEHTVAARHAVAGALRAWRAHVVFVPHWEDAHPDHVAVTRVVEDARFDAKLSKIDMPTPAGLEPGPPLYPKWMFYYYATHLRRTPDPMFLVDVSPYQEAKMRAIEAYRSQFIVNEKNRPVLEWERAAMTYFGSRIGAAAAEPFTSREPLGLNGLAGLVM